MMSSRHLNFKEREKILLVLLPYWTSLIPPLGISCLKSYLQAHGYEVKTADANIEKDFRDIYNLYFETLKQYIPGEKRGNFYNVGNDVLRNHMMAHLNREDEEAYIQLIKIVIDRTFFTPVTSSQVVELDKIIRDFYIKLADYFLGLLEEAGAGVLGLSVYNGSLPASMFAFRMAKEHYPHLKTVMGGGVFADQLGVGSPNFRSFLEKTPYIDKIIVGEGERLFLKWLQGELPESSRVYTLGDIDGEVLDLSAAAIPDFSDFSIESYPSMASYVSRSCPFQCSFCSETVQWGKYRRKGAEQIVGELKKLYKTYGTQLFLMGDSLLNPVMNELSEALLEEDTAIYWDGYLRADVLVCDLENTLGWRRGGFYRARLGVESGSARVLEAMGKGIGPGQIKAAVSALASAGIKTTTYWVIGHPGETEEDFRQTLELVEELKENIYEADCNPFNFYLTGQVRSGEWKEKSRYLYPVSAGDMLVAQTWTLELEPLREEIYKRISRFMAHCRALGIPNPYSLRDIYEADERWRRLQRNAVPPVMDFKKGYIDECKKVQKLIIAPTAMDHDEEWGFT
jgi:radical SAM superfamily enzyme YgiQ (UPF0313 family)